MRRTPADHERMFAFLERAVPPEAAKSSDQFTHYALVPARSAPNKVLRGRAVPAPFLPDASPPGRARHSVRAADWNRFPSGRRARSDAPYLIGCRDPATS